MSARTHDHVAAAAAFVRDRLSLGEGPSVGVVLGSGLGAFADDLDGAQALAYAEIPHFPQGSVVGHRSRLVAGRIQGSPVLVMQGRVHLYEGLPPEHVVFGVRVLMELGAEVVLLTNAAGGLGEGLLPGDLMLIRDHVNLTGCNPLTGPNDERLGVRFPDMSDTYALRLRELASQVAASQGLVLKSGVYLGLLGPSYETPAEIRMFGRLGVDAVGMSTVHEAIACAHRGVPVLGISCITNLAAGISDSALNHDEVRETADRVKDDFVRLLTALVPAIAKAQHGSDA